MSRTELGQLTFRIYLDMKWIELYLCHFPLFSSELNYRKQRSVYLVVIASEQSSACGNTVLYKSKLFVTLRHNCLLCYYRAFCTAFVHVNRLYCSRLYIETHTFMHRLQPRPIRKPSCCPALKITHMFTFIPVHQHIETVTKPIKCN